ncbi:MAG: patatin-like phospholipase family protein [Marmoricola sp.]
MDSSALVLGGGGVTGIAWEIGVLLGLARAGVDVTDADVVLGTSAGSAVGAQVTSGRTLEELYDAQRAALDAEVGGKFGWSTMVRMAAPMLVPGSPRTRRRRLGRVARRTRSEVDRTAIIRARLEVEAWPDRDLRITAVDTLTGALRVFDRDSGVDLVAAVSASCAVPLVWPPVVIDGVPYMDGGMRSTTNTDLVAGAGRVVVLAPLPRSMSKAQSIPAQLERLGAGVRAEVIGPDKEAVAVIGKNMLDPARAAESAEQGLRQGTEHAARVGEVWGA